jgi:hypothetical protein
MEDRGIDSQFRNQIFFNVSDPSSLTMASLSTQPLTEISTRNLPGDKEQPASTD